MSKVENWIPEIMYEDSEDGLTSKIPFIMVPKGETMPSLLFMFESRETGEYEPGPDGGQLPIVDMELHQYADMIQLKKGLPPVLYDQVRMCLGLEPLNTATVKGSDITKRIKENLSNIKE